ncbi:MAG: carbohydrate ABC transporter substrate-binding protein [Oscillospiraceae bacterium]|nr:carbohydrate ABC transporter substrate-binding protein [Oscillospiraceae bacterium]
MKKLIALLLALVLVLGLVACGAKEETVEEVTEEVAEEVAEETAEPLPYEGTELVYWSSLYAGTPQADMLLELTEEFMAQTGCVIDIQFKGNERRQIMPTALESGEKIDIFDSASYYESKTITDYMLDLTSYIEESDYLAKTYPIMMNDLVAQCGGLVGVVTAPSMNTVWYDKAAFEAAGITEVPVTMEEFEAACDKLVAAGIAPWALDDTYVGNFFSQQMQRYCGQDAVAELSMNGGWSESEGAVAAAQQLIDWVNKGYFAEGAPDVFPASQNKIGLGLAAMVWCGSWVGNEVESAMGVDIEWGCMSYPVIEGSTIDVGVNSAYSGYIHLHKDCENPDAAYEYLMYIKTGEGDQRYTDAVKLPPCDVNNVPPADFEGSVEYLSNATVCLNANCAIANADMKAALTDVMLKIFGNEYATGLEAMQAMDALYE